MDLPVRAVHLDTTRALGDLEPLLEGISDTQILSLGVVDGRNVWRNDYAASLRIIDKARGRLGADRLLLSPSCSLLHSPISLRGESLNPPEVLPWLAFAEEKLGEVTQLARLVQTGNAPHDPEYQANQEAIASRRNHPGVRVTAVRERLQSVATEDLARKSPFPLRREAQAKRLKLPPFPTTTIGSFPQTAAVRKARAQFKKGDINAETYQIFLEAETRGAVKRQEDLGLDMLVHGEFERNDMVEYFGEKLAGFAFTRNGWVQSYGSRCVKPPIIYGDVHRSTPMTLEWTLFAQSLTDKPMKGMLTGPVTILKWSFCRDDQPLSETSDQIALAIRDEVADLEKAGVAAIQIDEPALREALPLRKSEWEACLAWEVRSFRLCSAGVADATQIHTHMCYCDFGEIMASIAEMDADVISLEASRSRMELLDVFQEFQYVNGIGPGVWDIHSPRIPSSAEMADLLRRAQAVLGAENLWVNPDCGLKTRGWEEVVPALEAMVAAAKTVRNSVREAALERA
jgi:5-methyltetrahydropteroyltriglutamate--homocysteine methyltransferase